jgi:hypothetical protein
MHLLYLSLILVIVSLSITIYNFMCKSNKSNKSNKSKFSSVLNIDECANLIGNEKQKCIQQILELKNNVNIQYSGQPANRGLNDPGGAISGSFGNPGVIN